MRMMMLWFVFAFANAAAAQNPYEMKGIVLLQPEFVVQERISASALAPYIRLLNAAATDVFAGQKYQPAGGFLVLAVKPGNESAAWVDIRPELPPDLAKVLIARLRGVTPPRVQAGPVVFAIRVSLSGGTPPDTNMPTPSEWGKAVQKAGKPLETGELVERIWPQ